MYTICENIEFSVLSVLAGITCPSLSNPSFGSVTVTGVSIGDTATYSCNSGFILVGVEVRTCQLVGAGVAVWSGAAPICQRRFLFYVTIHDVFLC